ncbi:PAS domain S-box protein [[Eubacterium] cellulosolvens]
MEAKVKEKDRPKQKLIKELDVMQNRIKELEKVEIEHQRTEAALRSSEQRFKDVVFSSSDWIWEVDAKGKYTFASGRVKDLLGYTPQEIIGKTPFDLMPNSEAKWIKKIFKETSSKKGKIKDLINWNIHKDGHKVCILTNGVPILDANGKFMGYRGVDKDITEAKVAEEALRESEERFRGIAEKSFDMIFMMDCDGKFTYISPSIRNITGYKPKEVLGKPLNDFLPEAQVFKIEQVEKQLLNGEHIQGLELEILGQDDSRIYLEINATPMLRSGEVVGYQGIARNITRRKHTEREMKKRLMRFKMDEGRVYLVKEATNTISYEALKDLLKVGYRCLIISRTPEEYLNSHFKGDFEYLWLSENGSRNSIHPNLTKIKDKIADLTGKRGVLIDRLDYIISRHSFKKVLEFVQTISEFATISNHIIILSIDPVVLSKQKLRLLEKETFEVEPMFKPNLPGHLVEVLKFIYEQNIIGIKPSYSEIGHELGLCKPTVRKRIRQLVSGGYMIENFKGRSKVLELNERGKNIFLT